MIKCNLNFDKTIRPDRGLVDIHTRLSRCCTARGSSAGFYWFRPTKVEASKSFLFTKSVFVLFCWVVT